MVKILFYSFFCTLIGASFSGCFRHCFHSRPISLCQTPLTNSVKEAFVSDVIEPGYINYEQWWLFFKDPQLDQLIKLALACQPDVKVAEARIRSAYYQAMNVRSALLPHLYAVADIRQQKISKFGPGFVPGFPDFFTEATLELTTTLYELDLWKKNRSLFCAALDRVQVEIANFEEAKLLLSTSIATVYFDLQMALARLDVTQKRLNARKELYNLHKQQFDLGVSSEFRMYEVDTEVQLLNDLALQIEAEVEIDRHALAALVGNVAAFCDENGAFNVVPCAHFDQPFPLPVSLPMDLLARRPDITAQKWAIEASCYDIRAAQANFYPRIDLLGYIGFESIKLSELFTGKTLIGLADARASLPLFTAGKLRAQLGVSQENLDIAIAEYNALVLAAVQQVSDALTELTSAAERENALRKSIKDATKLYHLTEQKYENAVFNKLTVLNAFENLYIQKDLEVRIQRARYEAAVALIRAIGGGYYECSR